MTNMPKSNPTPKVRKVEGPYKVTMDNYQIGMVKSMNQSA